MSRLSLSRAWEEARQIFARDGGLLSAVALALLVLPEIVAGLIAPPVGRAASVTGQTAVLLAMLIGVIGQLAIVRLAIGPSTTVGQAIAHGARRFPIAFLALIILMLGMFLILVPLIAVLIAGGLVDMPVPGAAAPPSFGVLVLLLVIAVLLIGPKFIVTVPVASTEQVGPLGILRRSWRLTSGFYWQLLALEFLLIVTVVFLMIAAQLVGGTLAELVGDVAPFSLSALILAAFLAVAQAVFTVLVSVMVARVYVQLSARPEAHASVPSTGI